MGSIQGYSTLARLSGQRRVEVRRTRIAFRKNWEGDRVSSSQTVLFGKPAQGGRKLTFSWYVILVRGALDTLLLLRHAVGQQCSGARSTTGSVYWFGSKAGKLKRRGAYTADALGVM